MSIRLEPATSTEQLQQLAKLAAQIWNEYFIAIISQQQIDYMLDRFQSFTALKQQIEQQSYQYYFIVHDQETVGYTGVKQEAGKLFISKLYLLKQQRGKGYGGAALEELKTMAEQLGLISMWLTVNRHNSPAIEMYKHKGFVIVREQAADIGNGFVMDDYVMELALKAALKE
ncbi:hypothetical protein J40TS1_00840 [Paenibacillus montaniterrae]|uniref:N-acetyltransferase domain-containing protein n=1 Tax=Paenibacillus montaniterrae TaxID=429341 RepID=A0A919YJF9_9BACL|nr:GNAT family N-acetyltransferase [Paenibacillus montaniterrae]GIP14442.1 hypothetical protein J40TS1_00840 [Paenibacillus montaniterrae]